MSAVIRHCRTKSGTIDEMVRHVDREFADRTQRGGVMVSRASAEVVRPVHVGDC
ncbi:hypothetical protein hbim_00573 [Mycolicibacterium mageritense]|uniref:Uncharacterized protein n=1 Tax=Mycolicibacterium mageritense TaxID=53462 RepID=A0AAI8TL05_MYCME|nr:hypothetical protein hbim_00573 [Mycolicibacterium mageritense]